MTLSIIRTRLTRALRLNTERSIKQQRLNPTRPRRQSYIRGTDNRVVTSFSCPKGLLARLDKLCKQLVVQRGVVVRDALEFYLGIAEQEIEEMYPLVGHDIIPTTLAQPTVKKK